MANTANRNEIVLAAIKGEAGIPDDMPDYEVWAAERELSARGLIARNEDGEWEAR